MKQMYTYAASIEEALDNLEIFGAYITDEAKAAATANVFGMIVGKFENTPRCRSGYRIYKTPAASKATLKKEFPGATNKELTYTVIICESAKNEKELLKGLAISI
jgi:hypothetical protein